MFEKSELNANVFEEVQFYLKIVFGGMILTIKIEILFLSLNIYIHYEIYKFGKYNNLK